MEREQPIELKTDLELCTEKLSGKLDIDAVYDYYGGNSGKAPEEIVDYYDDRASRIEAGEDIWLARDLASPIHRTFAFISDRKVAGSLTLDLTSGEITTNNRHGDLVTTGTRDLVMAVESVESLLVMPELDDDLLVASA